MARHRTQKASTEKAPKSSERAVWPHGPASLPTASSTFASQSWLTHGLPAPTMLQVSTRGTLPLVQHGLAGADVPPHVAVDERPAGAGQHRGGEEADDGRRRGRDAATLRELGSAHGGESTAGQVRAVTTPKYHGAGRRACYRRLP